MDMDREQSVQHFLDLIKKSHRGKFKIYIGMIAGTSWRYWTAASAFCSCVVSDHFFLTSTT